MVDDWRILVALAKMRHIGDDLQGERREDKRREAQRCLGQLQVDI